MFAVFRAASVGIRGVCRQAILRHIVPAVQYRAICMCYLLQLQRTEVFRSQGWPPGGAARSSESGIDAVDFAGLNYMSVMRVPTVSESSSIAVQGQDMWSDQLLPATGACRGGDRGGGGNAQRFGRTEGRYLAGRTGRFSSDLRVSILFA